MRTRTPTRPGATCALMLLALVTCKSDHDRNDGVAACDAEQTENRRTLTEACMEQQVGDEKMCAELALRLMKPTMLTLQTADPESLALLCAELKCRQSGFAELSKCIVVPGGDCSLIRDRERARCAPEAGAER